MSLRIPPSIFFPYGKLKANKVFWQFHRSFSLREIKLLAMDQTNQHDGDGAIFFFFLNPQQGGPLILITRVHQEARVPHASSHDEYMIFALLTFESFCIPERKEIIRPVIVSIDTPKSATSSRLAILFCYSSCPLLQ